MEDMKINVKIKLSALWTSVMFFYSYADVLGFYKPGNLAELLTGEIGGIQITPEFLVFSAVLMAIPSLMVFLSLILMEKVNRWINIVLGIVYIGVILITLLMPGNWAYYIFYAIVEVIIYVLIIWHAWKWPT
ncbi:MAG: hypothetical protein JSW11_01265 [Candidatus Heimdallarchaeota archaeon]|nr:MAG: hypothetical protein JSW11_01265 [Candidatus Heimdallarchaeota archaeon]